MQRILSAMSLGLLSNVGLAQALPADAPGSKDHVVVSRYAGSWLAAQEVKEFDAASIPGGPAASQLVSLEGRITRTYYIAPAGRSVLEVQRNYEQALERAGATRRDACFEDGCKGRQRAFRAFNGHNGKKLSLEELEDWSAVTLVDQWLDDDSYRWWYGTLNVAGNTLHVTVLSAKPGIFALSEKYVATVVQVVEPKAMETGKVTVDAAALARGLQAEGRIALYGVYFDTGKSEVKPESKAQLDEMAKLLSSNAAMRVFVVGHTDNQGTLEVNLALSRARAQAVIDALVKTYKIDVKRLAAAGVANYSPIASNANDAGRARNRRVELVLQ
jgi:OmpA-OmpF porin, OOP family